MVRIALCNLFFSIVFWKTEFSKLYHRHHWNLFIWKISWKKKYISYLAMLNNWSHGRMDKARILWTILIAFRRLNFWKCITSTIETVSCEKQAPNLHICTMYSRSKKKRNTPIYFNTNYRTEMKLVPIIMDYCLLQFNALKFFLSIRLHGG